MNLRTEELIAQFNQESRDVRDYYVAYLRGRGRSEDNARIISRSLNTVMYFLWLERDNKSIPQMNSIDYVMLFSWLAGKNNYSRKTFNRIHTACVGLVRFLQNVMPDQYGSLYNFAKNIKAPAVKPVKNRFNTLSDDECEHILECLCDIGDYKRACMLALLMYSDMPIKAAVKYRVRYVSDEYLVNDTIYRTASPIVVGQAKYTGAVLAKPFKPYFDAWMAQREALGIDSPWLFPRVSNRRDHMTDTTVANWLKDARQYVERDSIPRSSFYGYLCSTMISEGFTVATAKAFFRVDKANMLELFEYVQGRRQLDDGVSSIPNRKVVDAEDEASSFLSSLSGEEGED